MTESNQQRPRKKCYRRDIMIQGVVQDLNPEFDNIAYDRVNRGIPDIFDNPQLTYKNFFTDCQAISHGNMQIPRSVIYDDDPKGSAGLIFQADTVIGSGTFGTIVQYTHKREWKIAVKITRNKEGKEPCVDTSELLTPNHAENNYILRQFCIDNKYNGLNIVAMELCNGTLKDLMLQDLNFSKDGRSIYKTYGMWPQCIRIDILIKTIQAVAYLWKLDYGYTDMKLENVFYKIVVKGDKYEIVPRLGDLDGLCDSNHDRVENEDSLVNAHSTVTYPSPEYNRACKEDCVSWGIGILLVMMLTAAQQGGAETLKNLQERHYHSAVFLQGDILQTKKLINEILLPGLEAPHIEIVKGLFNPKESRTKVKDVLGVMNNYSIWLNKTCPQRFNKI